MRTCRWAATAATSPLVTSGSGRTDALSGTVRAVSRTAAACRATLVGSTRRILPSAEPTGSAGSATACWESRAAITSPSASVAEKTSGGSRRPRPSV